MEWCNAEEGGRWEIGFFFNFIREARRKNLFLMIICRGRELNDIVNYLVN